MEARRYGLEKYLQGVLATPAAKSSSVIEFLDAAKHVSISICASSDTAVFHLVDSKTTLDSFMTVHCGIVLVIS